jgi:tRNA threonylcarbamoyl adenosine modification protein (Sua5/YciO/YrdC/YwlC family)
METPVTGNLERAMIQCVADILLSGGIIVLPTDTIYGFHCLASRPDSIGGILALKGREKPGLIALASDLEMADCMVREWPGASRTLLAKIWPAPLTAVLPASSAVSPDLSPRGTIAIRIPALDELRSVVRAVGEPIVSTSVNVSGREPMTRIGGIMAEFPGLGAYIAQRGRPRTIPSTIVDFTTGRPRVIRMGRYRWRDDER